MLVRNEEKFKLFKSYYIGFLIIIIFKNNYILSK
jgi:hypothetical protein